MSSESANKPAGQRAKGTGRYTYSSKFERMCVCGRTLGVHCAEAPHAFEQAGLRRVQAREEDAVLGLSGLPILLFRSWAAALRAQLLVTKVGIAGYAANDNGRRS